MVFLSAAELTSRKAAGGGGVGVGVGLAESATELGARILAPGPSCVTLAWSPPLSDHIIFIFEMHPLASLTLVCCACILMPSLGRVLKPEEDRGRGIQVAGPAPADARLLWEGSGIEGVSAWAPETPCGHFLGECETVCGWDVVEEFGPSCWRKCFTKSTLIEK